MRRAPQAAFEGAVTAYAILRHNGVEIGKADYAGIARPHIRPLHIWNLSAVSESSHL